MTTELEASDYLMEDFLKLLNAKEDLQKTLLETQEKLEEAKDQKFMLEISTEELMQQVSAHLELTKFRKSGNQCGSTFSALEKFLDDFEEKFGYSNRGISEDRAIEVAFYKDRFQSWGVDHKLWKNMFEDQKELFQKLHDAEVEKNKKLTEEKKCLELDKAALKNANKRLGKHLANRLLVEDWLADFQEKVVSPSNKILESSF